MAEIDTSTYKLPTTKSPLDVAQQLGQMENLKTTIDQNKLNYINAQFKLMHDEIDVLANDPAVTKNEVIQRLQAKAKAFNAPKPVLDMIAAEFANADTPEKLHRQLDLNKMRGLSEQQRINAQYGMPGSSSDGQGVTPTRQYLRGGPVSVGPRVQTQLPPTTPVVEDGVTKPLGPQAPVIAPGSGAVPTPPPDPRMKMRVGPIPTGEIPGVAGMAVPGGGKVISAVAEPPANFAQRFQSSYGPATGPAASMEPMYATGLQQYTEELKNANNKMTSIRPAMLALKLIPQVTTGIGTPQFNNVVALLKNAGVIPTQTADDDPTAIYQQINKYLAQYVGTRGSRSDADLANQEAGSPSAKHQIQPALLKLVKNGIALDRIDAAKALAYEGKDYQNYAKRSAAFPQSVDERAFQLDMMEPKEAKALIKKMNEAYEKGTAEGKRFNHSLGLAIKLREPLGMVLNPKDLLD
jgi:hypothetical protein